MQTFMITGASDGLGAEATLLLVARQREVVMTAQGKLGGWLQLLAPGMVEHMALAALKDEVKPH